MQLETPIRSDFQETGGQSITRVADVIDACCFDEYDRDIATSGLCGTFALAVKSVFPEVGLAVLRINGRHGNLAKASDGSLAWSHVVATLDGELFDVDGAVLLDDLISNYCWQSGGTLVSVSLSELQCILDDGGKSYDASRFAEWSETLKKARTDMDNAARPHSTAFGAPTP